MRDISTFVNLINKPTLSFNDGTVIGKELGYLFNSFTSYSKLSSEIYSNLNKKGKKRYYLLFLAIAQKTIYTRLQNNHETWDDRFKASENFFWENKEFFSKAFEKNFDVPFEESLEKTLRDESFEYVRSFISRWVDIHPTVKQAFVGGTAPLLKELESAAQIEVPCFPFI